MSLLRRGIAVVAIIALFAVVSGCSGKPAPNLVGMRPELAKSKLEPLGAMIGKVEHTENTSLPAGTIVSQHPKAGRSLMPGDFVDIVVAGPAYVRMPRIVGSTRSEAATRLQSKGLRRGRIVELYNDTVPAGIVVWQEETVGALVPEKAQIDFTVSLGPRTRQVPGVVGRGLDEARLFLGELGFRVVQRIEYSPRPAGEIVRQKPDAREELKIGGKVVVTVSRGPKMGKVPDVRGMTLAQAAEVLRKHGFDETHTDASGVLVTTNEGTVARQEPLPGVHVPLGIAVVLIAGVN